MKFILVSLANHEHLNIFIKIYKTKNLFKKLTSHYQGLKVIKKLVNDLIWNRNYKK